MAASLANACTMSARLDMHIPAHRRRDFNVIVDDIFGRYALVIS